jgi:hypothetical protein
MLMDSPKIVPAQDDGPALLRVAEGVESTGAALADLQPGGVGSGYWLSDDVRLRIENLSASYPVVLLSATTAWIEPDYQIHYPVGQLVTVHLLHGDREIGPLSASMTLQLMGIRGPLVGIDFHDPPARASREVLALLRELVAARGARPAATGLLQGIKLGEQMLAHDIIDDPRRVRSVLSALAKRKGIVRRAGDSAAPLCVLLDDVGADKVTWQGIEGWSDAATVDLVGYNSVFRFSARGEQVRRGEVVSPLPVRIERIRQSLQQRGIETELTARFIHPLWPHLPPVEGKVVDVSFASMRLAIREGEPRLRSGLKLALEMPDGEDAVIHLRADVRAVSPAEDASGDICSLHVVAAKREDERRWLRLVSRILHATAYGGRIWQADFWSLFVESGYFNLSNRRPEQFEQLHPSFLRMAKKTAESPHILYNGTCLSERGIEGNFSIMKPYHTTWMLHQLAKRPRSVSNVSSRQVLRDIYSRCFEHAQTDLEFRWSLVYAEAGVAWNERSFFEFARVHKATGLVHSIPFRLMGVDVPEQSDDPSTSSGRQTDYEIGEGTSSERTELLGYLGDTSPRAYREALDLVPERFSLREVIHRWRTAGLERNRAVLVARKGGVAIAAAIVELGELGTNLFRLLDSVRLIPLRPGGDKAFCTLLDAVCDWFRQHNRTAFVYFQDRGSLSYAGRAVMHDLKEGRLWIIASELVPEFMEHIYRITASKRSES